MIKKIVCFLILMVNILAIGKEVSEMKIGMILSDSENPFFVEMREGATERAKQSGVDLEIVYSEDSPVKELREIKRFIEEKKDLIIVNPANSHASSRGIILLNESKVPVITLDREVLRGDVETHIGSNNLLGGSIAGNYLIENLNKRAVVVELQGNYDTTASANRSLGFNQVSLGYFSKVLRKNGRFERDRSYEVMKRILSEEAYIDGVFAHNDESALGALKAVEESGRNILVVGFDGIGEAEEAVEAGRLGATVKQNPYEMGYLGVESGIKKLKKEWINKKIDVGVHLIEKEPLAD